MSLWRNALISFLPGFGWGSKINRSISSGSQSGIAFFSRSRQVIGSMVGPLGLQRGDVVLVPASLCWDALAPMLAQGIVVRAYPLCERLSLDLRWLKKMLGPEVKAVYVVHYFGYPQPEIAAIRDWCTENGLRLVEDCALCFFDDQQSSGVGQWGDVSFFSLWKYLPVPDGAIALTQNGITLETPTEGPSPRWIAKRMTSILIRSGASSGLFPTAGRLRPAVSNVAAYESPGPAELPTATSMALVSRTILARSNIDWIAKARRANYSSVIKGIKHIKGVEPIWLDFPAKSVPYALPIRVADPVLVQEALAGRGIETEISINRFFRNHAQIEGNPQDFSAVDELADGVLSLPVHQSMSHSDVRRLICALHEVI